MLCSAKLPPEAKADTHCLSNGCRTELPARGRQHSFGGYVSMMVCEFSTVFVSVFVNSKLPLVSIRSFSKTTIYSSGMTVLVCNSGFRGAIIYKK